jgi:hypothetical protein
MYMEKKNADSGLIGFLSIFKTRFQVQKKTW